MYYKKIDIYIIIIIFMYLFFQIFKQKKIIVKVSNSSYDKENEDNI